MGHTWEVHRTYYRHYDSIGERQEAHRSPVMSSHVIDRAFWPNRLQAATGQNARSTSEVRPGTKCSQSQR